MADIIQGRTSFVKATKDYFESEPYGRKVEISEFRALSVPDREEIQRLLTDEGYIIVPASELQQANA